MDFIQLSNIINQSNQNGVICTIVDVEGSASRKAGSKMIVWQDGSTHSSIGGGEFEHHIKTQALAFYQTNQQTKSIDYQKFDQECNTHKKITVFLERISTQITLNIYGAGYVGAAIAELALWTGFNVILADDRPEIITNLSPQLEPHGRLSTPTEFSQQFKTIPEKYLVLATRSTEIDCQILPSILQDELKYIGILGSKKRWNHTKNQLAQHNIPTQKLNQIHTPIGLSINAKTPKEIAISVIGQLIQVQNNSLS